MHVQSPFKQSTGELRRNKAIANAKEGDVSVIAPKFWGESITITGIDHKEAAEYLSKKMVECKSSSEEAILHGKVEQMFEVAVDINYKDRN